MVLPHSHRIPRVLWYSGYRLPSERFDYKAVTFFGSAFCLIRLHSSVHSAVHTPSHISMVRFGLFPFRSPLLRKSLFYFLFLRVLRCFSSPGSLTYTMYSCTYIIPLRMMSSLIRISAGQSSFAALRSFSQLVTSFIGA